MLTYLTIHFASSPVRAEDLDLVLAETRLVAPERWAGAYYGSAVASGDVNGDGLSDLLVAGAGENQVHVWLGTRRGLDLDTEAILSVPTSGYLTLFGEDVVAGDFDHDGYEDVAVSEMWSSREHGGAVWLFEGGPAGVGTTHTAEILPATSTGTRGDDFGSGLGTGDLDGDGFADLAVGAPHAQVRGKWSVGAGYIYFGSVDGLDPSTEVVLRPTESGEYLHFGEDVAGTGDLDGDGIDDLAVTCYGTTVDSGGVSEYHPCAAVYVYQGGGRALGTVDPTILHPTDVDWETRWTRYGESISGAGDLDGDGYGDLAVGSRGTLYVHGGSSEGVRQDDEVLVDGPEDPEDEERYRNFGIRVSGAGDVDADGLDDLLVGTEGDFTWPPVGHAFLLFGSEEGVSISSSLTLDPGSRTVEDYYSYALAGAGDVNGDGYADLVVGAYGDDFLKGAAYFYRPVCDWYVDGDGDGYGDPAEHIASCTEPAGYVDNADDCDDTDPSAQGDVWYADLDGDGYGTMAGEILACEQPEGTSGSWLDCDDSDPASHPGAYDVRGDGIDQDCSGRDAERLHVVHDGDDTAGTAGPEEDEGDPGTRVAPEQGEEPGCGCGVARAHATWWALLGPLAVLRRRPAGAASPPHLPST